MPDPVWTSSYDFGKTPEENGFTRRLVGSPAVTLKQTGAPATRNVTVNSDAGDAIFLTSNVPSLDEGTGATCEAMVAVSGTGDAGFEFDFLSRAILIQVFENSLLVSMASDVGEETNDVVPTPSNLGDTLWRATYDSGQVRVYRAGALVYGPVTAPFVGRGFQRFLWWGEGGGTQVFKKMAYYLGGPVVP